MILGFSFLQAPEIVSNIINYAKAKSLLSKEFSCVRKEMKQEV